MKHSSKYFFNVPLKKQSHTALERHEGEKMMTVVSFLWRSITLRIQAISHFLLVIFL